MDSETEAVVIVGFFIVIFAIGIYYTATFEWNQAHEIKVFNFHGHLSFVADSEMGRYQPAYKEEEACLRLRYC